MEALAEVRVELVPIDLAVAESAVAAFAPFGRGTRRQSATQFRRLPQCARVHGASLLSKGDDFPAADALRA